MNDAIAEIGKPEQVSEVFVRFQRHLYESETGWRQAGTRGSPEQYRFEVACVASSFDG